MRAVQKLVEFVAALCVSISLACWFQYGSVEMSWTGERPLVPDRSSGYVIPVDDHGILYVSQSDLNFQHYFVVPGLIFGGLGLILTLVHHIIRQPNAQRKSSRRLRLAGTVAEVTFIAFLPVWLFANPFIAFARSVHDPQLLLLIDGACGFVIAGWWALMEHGGIFRSIRLFELPRN